MMSSIDEMKSDSSNSPAAKDIPVQPITVESDSSNSPTAEDIPVQPATAGKVTIEHYFSDSSQPTLSKLKKRKMVERSSSQPASKSRKRSGSDGSDNDLLQKILVQMLSLQAEVGTLKSVVVDLKEELFNREPPINNEVLLDKISTNTEFIRSKFEQTPAALNPVPGDASTQQVMMDILESEQPGDPAGLPQVQPSEVIPDWEDYINKRKSAYSRYLNNNGRHGIHVGWKSSVPPFIPPMYLPKELGSDRSESEREYEVRKKQKFSEWECHIELLAVRRDDAQAEYESIDSHIAELIESIEDQPALKESLQTKYNNRVKTDEAATLKQWTNVEVGLVGKPERDSDKIVITEERVYAKGTRTGRKGLPKDKPQDKKTEVATVTKQEKEPVTSKKKKNQKPKRFTPDPNKTAVIHKEPYRYKGPYRKQDERQQFEGYHLPAYPVSGPYQQCFVPPQPSMFQQAYPQLPGVPGGNFFQPGNMSQPPPRLVHNQIRQPENSSFHWGTPNHLLNQQTSGLK